LLGSPPIRDVAKGPHATDVAVVDRLNAGVAFEDAPIGEFQIVRALVWGGRVDGLHPLQEGLWVSKLPGDERNDSLMVSALHDRGRQAPHPDVCPIEGGHRAALVHGQRPVPRGFQRSLQRGQRTRQLLRFLLRHLLGPEHLLLGSLASGENALRVLESDRAEKLLLLVPMHYRAPRTSAAIAVPTTRARIFAKAVSRLVDVSSLNGA
jgi:hypothetical protein